MARFSLLLAVVAGLLLGSAPSPAHAASRAAIIRDCEDDSKLSGTYTAKELRDARSNLPSDKDAYSDCRDVLGAAIAASAARGRPRASGAGSGSGNSIEGGAGSGGLGSGSGGSTAEAPAPALDVPPGAAPVQPTEMEGQALREARAGAPDTTSVAGVRGVAGQAATATLPTSIVLVLVLLGVTVVLAAIPYARRRVGRLRAR